MASGWGASGLQGCCDGEALGDAQSSSRHRPEQESRPRPSGQAPGALQPQLEPQQEGRPGPALPGQSRQAARVMGMNPIRWRGFCCCSDYRLALCIRKSCREIPHARDRGRQPPLGSTRCPCAVQVQVNSQVRFGQASSRDTSVLLYNKNSSLHTFLSQVLFLNNILFI